MRIAAPALLLGLALTLAGCGGSGLSLGRLNPLGLFRPSQEVAAPTGAALPPGGIARPGDARGLVDQVTALSVTPMPGGAVIEARGLPPVQGFWDVSLVALNQGRPAGGVLDYEMRVEPPPVARRVGPAGSRELVAAAYVSDAVLRDVAAIRVRGARSAREARR